MESKRKSILTLEHCSDGLPMLVCFLQEVCHAFQQLQTLNCLRKQHSTDGRRQNQGLPRLNLDRMVVGLTLLKYWSSLSRAQSGFQ